MSPQFIKTAAAAAIMAAFFVPGANSVHAGDSLADRDIIPNDLAVPLNGTTAGMTDEPGEIDAAARPAPASDRSVWYEWTPAETGLAQWRMDLTASGGPLRGIAAYLTPEGAPVTMAGLIPAGAAILPSSVKERGMQLRVTAGQKIILRVWTGGGIHVGVSFKLSLNFRPVSWLLPGDVPSDAVPFQWVESWPDGTTAVMGWMDLNRDAWWAVEAADLPIDGKYFPDGVAHWFRWRPAPAGDVSISLTDVGAAHASIIVAQRPEPGGALSLVAGPANHVKFTAGPDREYLVRISTTLPAGEYAFEGLTIGAAAAEPGDDPATAVPLAVGQSRTVTLRGATPSSGPWANNSTEIMCDVWMDLGSNLSGPHVLKVDEPFYAVVCKADAAGTPGTILSGRITLHKSCEFLAVPGQRYLARVYFNYMNLNSRGNVSLFAQTTPPPPHDRRANAIVLPPDGPVLVRGDATGATAEESDWAGLASVSGHGRTVWYVLDRPASAQLWFVWAWSSDGDEDVFIYREQDGNLVPAAGGGNVFTPAGERLWIMVNVEADPRFMLMAGPAVTPGDDLSDPVPLTAGETKYLYTAAATSNSPLPDTPPAYSDRKTLWLSWTPQESGLVVFSTRGSPAIQMNAALYTAAMEPVETTAWVPSGSVSDGEILSFQAVAGTSYRFALYGSLQRPAVVHLQPGGWDSPYDVWLQQFPAWRDVPSLQDPLADADGDGASNLLEMACGGRLVIPEANYLHPWLERYPWMLMTSNPPGLKAEFYEVTWALTGAAGSRPFSMIWESSTDGVVWTETPRTLKHDAGYGRNFSWEWQPAPGENPGTRMFRLKVSR